MHEIELENGKAEHGAVRVESRVRLLEPPCMAKKTKRLRGRGGHKGEKGLRGAGRRVGRWIGSNMKKRDSDQHGGKKTGINHARGQNHWSAFYLLFHPSKEEDIAANPEKGAT